MLPVSSLARSRSIPRWLAAFVPLSLACPTTTPQSFYRTLPLALHLFYVFSTPQTMSELWRQRILAHLQHHATGLPPPQQLHTHPLRACQVCHDARVRKQPAGHVQPATGFALDRASILILALCVPHPRHTNVKKARTLSFYRTTDTMRTASSRMPAAAMPGASSPPQRSHPSTSLTCF
jgi:hypothetical protein